MAGITGGSHAPPRTSCWLDVTPERRTAGALVPAASLKSSVQLLDESGAMDLCAAPHVKLVPPPTPLLPAGQEAENHAAFSDNSLKAEQVEVIPVDFRKNRSGVSFVEGSTDSPRHRLNEGTA